MVWTFLLPASLSRLQAQVPLEVAEEEAFHAAAKYAQRSVVQIETFGGQELVNQQAVAPGPFSGTVLSEEGWIATSLFFFRSNPASITVVLPNNERKAAKLVARDLSRELAFLKIDSEERLQPVIPANFADLQVGQWTLALGKSFDPATASRSVGILSAKGRIWDKAVQTDCKISPHNYGGPLIDVNGSTIGVLTMINPGIVTEGEVEQWYDSGIGFAIPIQDVLDRLPTLQQGNDIYSGLVGFSVRGRDEFKEGITIEGVAPGSPAAENGLKAGDAILRAGRSTETMQKVATHSNLKHIIGPIDAGQTLAIEVRRGSETLAFQIPLAKELETYRELYLGIITIRAEDGRETIVQVIPDSPAETAGLTSGHIIEQVNSSPLLKDQGLDEILPYLSYTHPVIIQVRKNDTGADAEPESFTLTPSTRPETDVAVKSISQAEVVAAMGLTTPQSGEQDSSDEAESITSIPDAITGIVQIPLGDVKNKAFAIVPTSYDSRVPHGSLLICADAGLVNAKDWGELWTKFGDENRWIVTVIQSADEKSWSFEDQEVVGRVRSYLGLHYNIDAKRNCIAGFASGGLIALVTAGMNDHDFNAVWLGDVKLPPRMRITPAEPSESLRFLLNDSDGAADEGTKLMREAGYAVSYYREGLGAGMNPTALRAGEQQMLEKAMRWLRLLEAY